MNVEDITAEPDKSALVEKPKEVTGNVLRYLQTLADVATSADTAEYEAFLALRKRFSITEAARAKLDSAITQSLMEAGVMPAEVKGIDMKTGKIEFK